MEGFLYCSFPQVLPAAPLLGESKGFDSHWNQRVWRLPATYNDPGQLTMATHTYCYALAPCCTPPPPPLFPPVDLHWWIAFLTLGAWRVLWPRRTHRTTGNCPVFPLPDSKPPNSQQPHSFATFPPCLSTILCIPLCFQRSRWVGGGEFRCCFWICFHSIQKN